MKKKLARYLSKLYYKIINLLIYSFNGTRILEKNTNTIF